MDTDHERAETTTEPAHVDVPSVASSAQVQMHRRLLGLLALGLIALMIVALFLPWATSGHASQSIAQYSAPQPTVIAWALLALGVATSGVAAFSFLWGERQSIPSIAAGAALYLAGCILWYGTAIWPTVVASGCQSNGGPLCASSPSSPTIVSSSPGSGLILGIVASLLLLGSVVAGRRVLRTDLAADQSR